MSRKFGKGSTALLIKKINRRTFLYEVSITKIEGPEVETETILLHIRHPLTLKSLVVFATWELSHIESDNILEDW